MNPPNVLASALHEYGIDNDLFETFLDNHINLASEHLKITECIMKPDDIFFNKMQIQHAKIFLSLLRRSDLSGKIQ